MVALTMSSVLSVYWIYFSVCTGTIVLIHKNP
jgi:hypothetical protein